MIGRRALSGIRRLWFIHAVLIRHGLDDFILESPWVRPIRLLGHLLPWRWSKRSQLSRGARIRSALSDLGPLFVKFGQMLSTRRDLIPIDVVEELSKLQDRVPPFSSTLARQIVTQAYGRPPEEIFSEFNDVPMASASIAQVHAARLLDGREVILKVVRPNIEATIRHDLDLLYAAADLIERYWSEGKRLKPRAVVAEYEKTILDELDLLREAANASQLRRNFQDARSLYIPEVHFHYCRRTVMVMERIHGVPINAIDELTRLGIDLKRLSQVGVEIFFQQVLRDSFFHADMHPGNIFVDVQNPKNPRYIAVDFGIVGTLSPKDQHYLAENFLAFFRRDYRRVAELHIESGWVPSSTRVDEFESAIRTVCEPIFHKPLKEISFGNFLMTLFQTARRFQMEVQPQLVLLQKTVLHVEGLGRQLDPDLDLWETAKPLLESWMRERAGPLATLKQLGMSLPRWFEGMPELPNRLEKLFRRLEQGELAIQVERHAIESLRYELRHTHRKRFFMTAGATFIIVAALIFPTTPWLLSSLLGALGLLLLLRGL